MTTKIRTVPWRTPASLHFLKTALYPPHTPDLRPQALSLLTAMSTRQPLPHVLTATLLFTSAILLDESHSAPTAAVRLAYASAIIRFVNGLLDPLQQGQYATSLMGLAKIAGLPGSFVEVRHACTHEELPSLVILRSTAGRAMEWLWGYYWGRVGSDGVVAAGLEDPEVVRRRGRDCLGMWRRLRRGGPEEEVELEGAVGEMVRECEGLVVGDVGAFVEVLLEEKALIPGGNRKLTSMKGAVMLWKPLLEILASSNPRFLTTLISLIMAKLESPAAPDSPEYETQQCLLFWLREILSQSSTIFTNDPEIDIPSLAKTCLYTPTKPNLNLFEHLLLRFPQSVDSISKLLQPAVEKSQQLYHPLVDQASIAKTLEEWRIELDKMMEESTAEEKKRLAETEKSHDRTKIRLWEGEWIPKPLGVV